MHKTCLLFKFCVAEALRLSRKALCADNKYFHSLKLFKLMTLIFILYVIKIFLIGN